MGLMSWMMERGSLGGIARSASKIFNKAVRESPNEHITTHLASVAIFRYSAVGSLQNITISLRDMHARCLNTGAPVGLLSLCFAFAKTEMDIEGIEQDVLDVLKKVLLKEGFSIDEIVGTDDADQFSDEFLSAMRSEEAN